MHCNPDQDKMITKGSDENDDEEEVKIFFLASENIWNIAIFITYFLQEYKNQILDHL